MLQPLATPREPAADKVDAILTRLAATPGERPTLTTLAVRRGDGVEAFVIFHLNDGSRDHLGADDARLMAGRVRDAGVRADWADSLESAADCADRQASAILLAVRCPAGVATPREFGGMR